jgi:hypothetical protein
MLSNAPLTCVKDQEMAAAAKSQRLSAMRL